jgi:RNA polymerase sigma-70 factor (ECF subfamily)
MAETIDQLETVSESDFPGRRLDTLDGVRALEPGDWDVFVREHTPRMLSLAKRFLRCEHDSADAVQEAFLSAYRSMEAFEGQASVSTWLHRIVVNACLMKLRAASRRPTVSIEELLPTFDDNGRHAHPVFECEGQDANAWDGDLRQNVRDSIERLPESYRAVLILRDIEEFDTEQTARILNTTIANVKVRLHRARQALRTMLSPMFQHSNR